MACMLRLRVLLDWSRSCSHLIFPIAIIHLICSWSWTDHRRACRTRSEERIFPPKPGAKRERQRVDRSFETILGMAGIAGFRFHDLRHTFASWYMMNGCDLYEMAKILDHSNIKMTERYAKLGKDHIARTGSTAREM
jgi:site-specific recombinase XerD